VRRVRCCAGKRQRIRAFFLRLQETIT
jgi:hypothetical protein